MKPEFYQGEFRFERFDARFPSRGVFRRLRGVAAGFAEQVEEHRLDFRVSEPAFCPIFPLANDFIGGRRALQVAEKAGVVRRSHPLPAFGNQSNERHVARF